MTDGTTTRTVEVRALDPYEDAEIPLFNAPFDGVIANITYIPSEDIAGAYYTRELQLHVHPELQRERSVSSIQLGTTEVLLPGGERHNAYLHMPPSSTQVHEGDVLMWHSIGSVGEGLAVPSGTVEVVFEPKKITEDVTSPELWRECVPTYWIGKDMLVRHAHRDLHGPNRLRGSGTLYTWKLVGTFIGADTEALHVSVHPLEHGRLPRETHFPFTRTMNLKLMEAG